MTHLLANPLAYKPKLSERRLPVCDTHHSGEVPAFLEVLYFSWDSKR